MQYTLAFIFSEDRKQVLLISKNRPADQAGKLNGIGGKIEAGEEPLAGMIREVREETSLALPDDQWEYAGSLSGKEWKVWIYTALYKQNRSDAVSVTDEQVAWYDVSALPSNCLDNLFWLVPFCLRKLSDKRLSQINCTYNV